MMRLWRIRWAQLASLLRCSTHQRGLNRRWHRSPPRCLWAERWQARVSMLPTLHGYQFCKTRCP